jgi:hypothetical protein
VVFVNQTEEVPAQPEIYREFGSHFPIVIDIAAVVILSVVGQGNVGYENAVARALPQGPRGGFNTRGDVRFRMPRGLAINLPESFNLLHRN